MNIAMLLDMAADGFGDRLAVGSREGGITYAQLRDRSRAVAAGIAAGGHERVVVASVNDDAIPELVLGAARAGSRYMSVNYRLADERLRDAVAMCTPAAVVADPATARRITGVDGVTLVTADELRGSPGEHTEDREGDGVAISLLTSGTSGPPKTVLLRHENLFSYIISTTEFMGAEADDAALVSVPSYHIAGIAAVLSNVYLGRRIVYLPHFAAEAWVEVAARERITHAMIVPTMLGRILDVLEETGASLPALRALSYGGGRMPLPVVRRALELLPEVDFVNAYGLTETSSTIALLDPADHRTAHASDDPTVAARLGSVGRPLPGIELEIRGSDGHALPEGEVGEIVVRGDQVSGQYEGRDARDAGGWFHTNDNGRLDADGYLFVEGRADDVIVRGGENLSPGEIEEVLLAHDDVQEAAVVAVADEEWGESPAAIIVARAGAQLDAAAVQGWVRARLRSSRTPVRVEFCDALPYSETGKLLRRELRASLAASGAVEQGSDVGG